MEPIDDITQVAEADIYRELQDIAKAQRSLHPVGSPVYRRQAAAEMTAFATQLRSRPAIRQFFLAADQNPDEVITQILRRAIDSL